MNLSRFHIIKGVKMKGFLWHHINFFQVREISSWLAVVYQAFPSNLCAKAVFLALGPSLLESWVAPGIPHSQHIPNSSFPPRGAKP